MNLKHPNSLKNDAVSWFKVVFILQSLAVEPSIQVVIPLLIHSTQEISLYMSIRHISLVFGIYLECD